MTGIAPIRLMVGKQPKIILQTNTYQRSYIGMNAISNRFSAVQTIPTYKRHLLQAIKYIIGKAFMLIFPVKQTILL